MVDPLTCRHPGTYCSRFGRSAISGG